MPIVNVTDRAQQTQAVEAELGESLMETLRRHDIDVEAVCGGCCACATCHVLIAPEWLPKVPERSDSEFELLEHTMAFQGNASRLSCQISMTAQLDGLAITVAPAE